jgi:hypothetical protein
MFSGHCLHVCSWVFAGLSAALFTASFSEPTLAYPASANNCNDDTIQWRFAGTWTETDKADFRSGMSTLWALDFDGSVLVQLTEVASAGSGVVDVSLASLDPGVLGTAECTITPSIKIRSSGHPDSIVPRPTFI